MNELANNKKKSDVENYFRHIAKTKKEHKLSLSGKSQNEIEQIKDQLDDDNGGRIGFIAPQGVGEIHMSTSLFRNIKDLYPNQNLYVFTPEKHIDLLTGNPYIHKILPYNTRSLNRSIFLEQDDDGNKPFNVVYTPFHQTATLGNYQHNCNDLTDIVYHY